MDIYSRVLRCRCGCDSGGVLSHEAWSQPGHQGININLVILKN